MSITAVRSPAKRSRSSLPPAVSFAAMTAAFAAFFIAAGAPTPLLPIYEASWQFPTSLVTVAFGVYAIALMLTLLVVGSLSDHIGRRPLLIGALTLELVSMLVFLVSPSICVKFWVRSTSPRRSPPPTPASPHRSACSACSGRCWRSGGRSGCPGIRNRCRSSAAAGRRGCPGA